MNIKENAPSGLQSCGASNEKTISDLNITKPPIDFKLEPLEKSPCTRPAVNSLNQASTSQRSHPPGKNGCAIDGGVVPLDATHLLSVNRLSSAIDGSGRASGDLETACNEGLHEATTKDSFSSHERIIIKRLVNYDMKDRRFLCKGLTFNIPDRKPAKHCVPSKPVDLNTGDCVSSNKYYLPQAWGTWLDGFNPWSWYGHFTFRGYPTPEYADKTWDKWIHALNRSIWGCHYWKHKDSKGVTWARGTELQRRGAIHYHAILGRIPDDITRFYWMDEWYKLGGTSNIFAYEHGRGAEYYMSKSTYAWKKGEIDLSANLAQMLTR